MKTVQKRVPCSSVVFVLFTSSSLIFVQISRMHFVDMPGAERLTMDPELLRLREGNQLNRSLLGFVSVLRR